VNPDAYDPQRLLADLETKMRRAQENAAVVAALEGIGEAADGVVKVTVGPTGALKDVVLEPKAMRLPSMDLAAAIVTAARAGQESIANQVREIYRDREQAGAIDPAAAVQGQVDVAALVAERMQQAREALRRGGAPTG
jgi:DNA-binding protein YbaB